MFKFTNNRSLNTPSIILFIALLSSSLVIGANLYSIVKGREISQRWQYLSNEIIEASYRLHKVERNFGYGGFIHHFKNLVLRRHQAYVDLAEEKLLKTENNLQKLKSLNTLQAHSADIDEIEKVIQNYREKFYFIKSNQIAITETPHKIDSQVKVDDNKALIALANIIEVIEEKRISQKAELDLIQQELEHSIRYLLMAIVAAILSFTGLVLLYIKTKNFSQQFENLFEHSPNGLFEIDAKGVIVKVNHKALEMFRYTERELLGKKIEKLVPPAHMDKHIQYRREYEKKPRRFRHMSKARQIFAVNKYEEEFPVEITLSFLQTDSGPVTIADVVDISDKHKFKIQSQYDHLTRLYNRRTFEEKLSVELTPPVNDAMALIMFDIDHFKVVNDKYGHIAGDHVLMQFSDIIHRLARKSDVLGRWGGEEFALIGMNIKQEELHETCERFRTQIEEFEFDEVGHITCSLGATVLKQSDKDVEEVFARADEALYEAKNSGRNRSVVK